MDKEFMFTVCNQVAMVLLALQYSAITRQAQELLSRCFQLPHKCCYDIIIHKMRKN